MTRLETIMTACAAGVSVLMALVIGWLTGRPKTRKRKGSWVIRVSASGIQLSVSSSSDPNYPHRHHNFNSKESLVATKNSAAKKTNQMSKFLQAIYKNDRVRLVLLGAVLGAAGVSEPMVSVITGIAGGGTDTATQTDSSN